MKTAIVYDRVNKWGGAERLLLVLHEMFPEAPLYTSVYHRQRASWARVFPKVYTSFLQKIPFARKNHELFAPLMPLAFEEFNFDDYDLVISVTSEAAKGILTKPNTKHLCICLTPTRYLWSGFADYFDNPVLRFFFEPMVVFLRKWDQLAAQRPDILVGISKAVGKRIKKYYGRESALVYPPLGRFIPPPPHKVSNFFLVVGRLVPYKKVDLAVEAFNRLNLPLVVVGSGKEEGKLRSKARSNIKFVGEVGNRSLVGYYAGCRALIFPQEEDFGLVALEAMSFGKPVIAYRAGGALDFIQEGINGLFFNKQSVNSLVAAIKKFDSMTFHSGKIVNTTLKFSQENFRRELLKIIKNA